jgi:O-acetyl-ADP-ribose deacetylase (regulator of RNase III)
VPSKHEYWTHPSVIALAGDSDPIEVITAKARATVFAAIQDGWSGPPFDPFSLAEYLRVRVVPREEVPEARTVPKGNEISIEFNPNRPRGRVRYSVCHELAHTLFPDCRDAVRHRLAHEEMHGDDWQLEMLCNIGASEFLMPIGTLPPLEAEALSIDSILQLRKRYDVSTEAVLLRAARVTPEPCSVFVGSHHGPLTDQNPQYQIDYSVPSRSWAKPPIPAGLHLPNQTVASECTAIGFTAKAYEQWSERLGKLRVECVGIPAYPNEVLPRVAGLVRVQKSAGSHLPEIAYIRGDATSPRGAGYRIIAQIVNDRAATWGAGFALAVRKKWPAIQDAFRAWAESRNNLSLGNSHLTQIDASTALFSMIAQHGYGPSPKPRIRYAALRKALEQLASVAAEKGATIHMPRIGCGQAGGSWEIVRDLIDETLISKSVRVTVYDPPNTEVRAGTQPAFQFAPAHTT